MQFRPRNPVRTLLTGLLALLPLAATILLLGWVWSFLAKHLGPNSAVGHGLTQIGLGVTESELVGYLLGLLAVFGVVYAFGLLVEAGLQRGMVRLVESLMQRIPVVRTIYDVVQKLVALFARTGEQERKPMQPVWVYFGGKQASSGTDSKPAASAALGLLSTPKPVLVKGEPYLAVLVPTAPVPIGGGLLYVPPHWVEHADLGMEAVTSIYVSMGVTSDQYLSPAGAHPLL